MQPVLWSVLSLALTGAPAEAAARLEPCRLPRLEEAARCGTLEVFENRAARAGRRIPLRVAVLPATGERRLPDPLVVLQGGPGQAASNLADFYAEVFAKLRRERDIVLVDQRGTGGSNALECDLYGADAGPQAFLDAWFPVAGVRACRARLAERADVTLYTTPIAMDDLDEVRAWLGYERINLYGTSYGTIAAQEYIRRYPHRVRTAILRAAVAPEWHWGVTYARNTQRSLERLFELCAADEACRAAYPDPRRDLQAVLERLGASGTAAEVDGRTVTLRRGAMVAAIRGALSAPASAVELPLMLRRAAAGDLAPLATAALAVRRGYQRELAEGMFLTIACAELVGGMDMAALARESSGTFVGDEPMRELTAACAEWPRIAAPAADAPAATETAVLVISGWLDPSTPPDSGEAAARAYANGRHLVVRHAAHSFNNLKGCGDEVMAAFVVAGSHRGLDTSCADRIAMPAFALPPPPDAADPGGRRGVPAR